MAVEESDDVFPIDETFRDENSVEYIDGSPIDQIYPDETLFDDTRSLREELDDLRGDREDMTDSDRPLPDEPRRRRS